MREFRASPEAEELSCGSSEGVTDIAGRNHRELVKTQGRRDVLKRRAEQSLQSLMSKDNSMSGRDESIDRLIRIAAYSIYLILSVKIIADGGYASQDYAIHTGFVEEILRENNVFGIKDGTNPPLLYVLGAASLKLFGAKHGIPLLCTLFALLNVVSLHLLWISSRVILTNRMSSLCILFVSTFPAFVTTSIVFAADSLAVIVFLFVVVLNIRAARGPTSVNRNSMYLFLSQVMGGFTKYSFLGISPSSFILSLYLICKQTLKKTSKAVILAFVFLLPTLVNFAILSSLKGESLHQVSINNFQKNIKLTSMFWLNRLDAELLDAPAYFQPILVNKEHAKVDAYGQIDPNGRLGYSLLVNNKYSYPGLLSLALHTDIMNITRIRNVTENRWAMDGKKNVTNHFFQKVSASIGFAMSWLVPISIILFALQFVFPGLPFNNKISTAKDDNVVFVLSALLPALCFYFAIFFMLPFVGSEVYYFGYWLPRLVMPSVLVFSVLLFWLFQFAVKFKPFKYFFVPCFLIKIVSHILLLTFPF